ncbi:PQQ-dependent sugar dehydrogenase [Amycolatopsis rhabdoformis]|uniref:PQQ-dependent sugar dehydrogenase n=1 Tax=Amycolatopsis rhabdoformis TaxID=1448059 RepID=A0ABZ1I277_9PSEU|nr:PQQ-dependent sugar dehydrogenase [Amycolatopsis rhabdoformis]WSE27902.1 PQQ-dependent sugar dehydrogenase [Amycolatopsis rhabdoformis]
MAWNKLRSLLTAAVLAVALVPITAAAAAADDTAPTLPAGFVLRDTPTGLAPYDFTDFAWLPDDSVLALGKSGVVNWVPANGTGAPVRIATFSVESQGDVGLTSIALAPDYETSHQIYLNRAVSTGNGKYVQRAARFTVSLDGAGHPTGLTGEKVIFDLPGSEFYIHGLDTVIPAADGTLWYSVGDNGDAGKTNEVAFAALDLDSPFGKILHVTQDGKAVPSNPFYSAAAPDATRSKVFASGFRNPFRFTLDPKSGLPVVGDVGWYIWEELDVVQPGANLAWPCWEGNHPTPGYSTDARCAHVVNTPPLWEHQHGTGPTNGNSITGGIVYSGTSYPAAYQGSYFFGDYAGQKMWTLKYNAQGALTQAPVNPPPFSNIGGVTRISAAPNGDIVFSDLNGARLRRLSYSATNAAPVAVATSSTNPDTRTVSFDASGSYDFDGDPLTYTWNFGDGTTGTGATASHQYGTGDSFTATLTAQDPLGGKGTTTVAVAPGNHSPDLRLTAPDKTFAVGEPVDLTATATDAEDGTLPITWTSLIRHCPDLGVCHVHPDDGATGPAVSVPFTDHTDSRMEFTATVTDSAGVKASKTYVALPRQHRLTLVSTQPAALSIPSEGGVSSAMVTEGAKFDVTAASLGSDGASKFTGWQDGPATASWSITVGADDTTLTANYATAIDQRYAAEPALRTLIGAATGPEVVDGPVHYRPYANGRLYWTTATGVREIGGQLLAEYLAIGGHQAYGPPVTDETRTPDGVGRFNHLQGTPGTMAASIYWSPSTGAHSIQGLIRVKWAALGWEKTMGYPINDEAATPDGVGRYNHFSGGGSIYYTVATGAHQIGGAIKQKWAAYGWERGLGYPTTDESVTPDGVGRYNHFTNNMSVYWTPSTGAHEIGGAIRQTWAATGWERGLGYPTTDETSTPNGAARYNHFTGNASIYWSPSTGSHYVKGEIRKRWAALGWEKSYLGLPTSDEYRYGTGYRSDFRGGYIVWTPSGGSVDRRW